jgi:hypothetical protein
LLIKVLSNNNWGVVNTYDFTTSSSAGQLVIGFDAWDGEVAVGTGIGALLAEIKLAGKTFSSNDDGDWKCWQNGEIGAAGHDLTPPDGWLDAGFDDSSWPTAYQHSGFKDDRWGYGPETACNGVRLCTKFSM